jgi:hypothetical protein
MYVGDRVLELLFVYKPDETAVKCNDEIINMAEGMCMLRTH